MARGAAPPPAARRISRGAGSSLWLRDPAGSWPAVQLTGWAPRVPPAHMDTVLTLITHIQRMGVAMAVCSTALQQLWCTTAHHNINSPHTMTTITCVDSELSLTWPANALSHSLSGTTSSADRDHATRARPSHPMPPRPVSILAPAPLPVAPLLLSPPPTALAALARSAACSQRATHASGGTGS